MKVTPDEIIKKADAKEHDLNEITKDAKIRIAETSAEIANDLVGAIVGLMEKCSIMPSKIYEGKERPIKNAEEAIKNATGIDYKFGTTKLLKDE